jgi:hypothetical protein
MNEIFDLRIIIFFLKCVKKNVTLFVWCGGTEDTGSTISSQPDTLGTFMPVHMNSFIDLQLVGQHGHMRSLPMKVSRRKRPTPEMDISSGVLRCVARNVLYQTVASAGHSATTWKDVSLSSIQSLHSGSLKKRNIWTLSNIFKKCFFN